MNTHTTEEVGSMSLEEAVALMNKLEKDLDLYKHLFDTESKERTRLEAKIDAINLVVKL